MRTAERTPTVDKSARPQDRRPGHVGGEPIDPIVRRASLLPSLTIAWSVVETIATFVVGTRADSPMLIALAHVATIDLLLAILNRMQVAAILRGDASARSDHRSESAVFLIIGATSIIAAVSVTIRALAHFHAMPADVSRARAFSRDARGCVARRSH